MGEFMTKQEIAKELLKPYFDDPSMCSISKDGSACLYKGPEGRMCVFARACTPEGRELLPEYTAADDCIARYGLVILKEKYRHIEEVYFWEKLQETHDELSGDSRKASLLNMYEKLTGEPYGK